jgi:hypothetical protein
LKCSKKKGFRKFFGRHLSNRIKAYIEYELKSLQIESKVIGVVTDSGSDIKKAALECFDNRFVCLAHNINLTISNGNLKIH